MEITLPYKIFIGLALCISLLLIILNAIGFFNEIIGNGIQENRITGYCNGEKFSRAEFYCCNGTLRKYSESRFPSPYVICGFFPLDAKNQSCVNNVIVEGNGWYQCGNTLANKNCMFQKCLQERVYEGEGIYYLSTCGPEIIDNRNVSCVNGTIYDGIGWSTCDGSVYNFINQSCVHGEIINGKDWEACGQSKYNTATQSCCKGQVVDGKVGPECGQGCCAVGEECCNDYKTGPVCYNPQNAYCKEYVYS